MRGLGSRAAVSSWSRLNCPAAPGWVLAAGLEPARDGRRDDIGCATFLGVELDVGDPVGSLLHLFGRNEDLLNVVIGLAEMLLQLEDALLQALEIIHQVADLGVNLVG